MGIIFHDGGAIHTGNHFQSRQAVIHKLIICVVGHSNLILLNQPLNLFERRGYQSLCAL